MRTFATIWFGLIIVSLLALKLALVVQAFRRHVAWGLAVLFVPFSLTAFVVLDWDRARRPLLLWAAATLALSLEYVLTATFGVLLGLFDA